MIFARVTSIGYSAWHLPSLGCLNGVGWLSMASEKRKLLKELFRA